MRVLFLFLVAFAWPPAVRAAPKFQKILYIVLENTNYADAIRQPFLAKLAAQGAQFPNFYADIHPSQGNYIAMMAGDTFGIAHDRNLTLNVSHFGDLLERQRLSWKVYADGYPGNCFLGSKGKYVRKHNPFASFANVQSDRARCAKMVNSNQFDADLAKNELPNFSLYIPDLNNDGHDTGVRFADNWLAKRFGTLFANPDFLRDTLVIVTFDESASARPNQIYTAIFGASVRPGTVVNESVNHYSLLRFLEDEWRLGTLGRKELSANQIVSIWR